MKKLLVFFIALSALYAQAGGKWRVSMDSPHGRIAGDMDLKQDSTKLTGTLATEMFGTLQLSGTLENKNVSISIHLPGGDHTFGLTGSLDGDKMSGKTEADGEWSATRVKAQAPVLGTVTGFHPDKLEFEIRPDHSSPLTIKVGAETEVVTIPPGETGLGKARPAKLTDIEKGDRVLVSFVEDLAEARRIVLVSADDIAQRNQAERDDWKRRGISGFVTAENAEVITLEERTPAGVKTIALKAIGKTKFRRYAPDSVKFTEAQPSTFAEIAVGDQVQARGKKTGDGAQMTAEEIVFGTFLTRAGTVTAVNPEARELRMADLSTKQAYTVHVTEGSQIKWLPDMNSSAPAHEAPAHGAPSPKSAAIDVKRLLDFLPPANLADLKVGSAIVVSSTRGADSSQLTAIMLLANADMLIQAAQKLAPGLGALDAISRMHGGAFSAPGGGVSLPAILQ